MQPDTKLKGKNRKLEGKTIFQFSTFQPQLNVDMLIFPKEFEIQLYL